MPKLPPPIRSTNINDYMFAVTYSMNGEFKKIKAMGLTAERKAVIADYLDVVVAELRRESK